MKRILLALAFNVAMQTLGNAQTAPASLQVTTYSNITSASTLDGAGYIDNRSTFIRANNYHGFNATGTGTWSVTMQFADGTPSGFVSFGSTAVVSSTSGAIGYGIGYHDYIKFAFVGTATVSIYSATKNFDFPPALSIPSGTIVLGGIGYISGVVYASSVIPFTSLSQTQNDLICNTAGSAYRVLASGVVELPGGGQTSVWQWTFKDSAGVYHSIAGTALTATNPRTQILENNECLSLNITTIGTANSLVMIDQRTFPIAGNHLRMIKLIGNTVTTPQIIYTSPSPNGALVPPLNIFGAAAINSSFLGFTGDIAQSSTISSYQVPPAGSPVTANETCLALVVTAGALVSNASGCNTTQYLAPGTTIQVTNSFAPSTTSMWYIPIYEP